MLPSAMRPTALAARLAYLSPAMRSSPAPKPEVSLAYMQAKLAYEQNSPASLARIRAQASESKSITAPENKA